MAYSLISQGPEAMGTELPDPPSQATTVGIPTKHTVSNKDLTFTRVLNLKDRSRWNFASS